MGHSLLKSEDSCRSQVGFRDSGVVFPTMSNQSWLKAMQTRVGKSFPNNLEYYCRMADDDYREHAVQCQLLLNQQNSVEHFVRDNFKSLQSLLGPEISYQSNLYLRCSRPNQSNQQEQIGWHRETFYGPSYLKHALNIWIPLVEISDRNAIWFVPKSHRIAEKDIEISQRPDLHGGVERFSAGHRMGLLYSPKTIVGGVDLKSAVPLLVPVGSYAAFSAMMIHGNGVNTSPQIRFSIDFRLIPTPVVGAQERKFSSGEEYFQPFKG
jgi:ectoine hydroxylase-related dioxygenase (phytanoyl-CoA dioxygenase family)